MKVDLTNENQCLVTSHHTSVSTIFTSNGKTRNFSHGATHHTQRNTFIPYYLKHIIFSALQVLSHFSEKKKNISRRIGKTGNLTLRCQIFCVRTSCLCVRKDILSLCGSMSLSSYFAWLFMHIL